MCIRVCLNLVPRIEPRLSGSPVLIRDTVPTEHLYGYNYIHRKYPEHDSKFAVRDTSTQTRSECLASFRNSKYSEYIEKHVKILITILNCGPEQRRRNSDSLPARLSGDRMPVEAKFSAPVENVPRNQPAPAKMGTEAWR
jgi:hypothetical protein